MTIIHPNDGQPLKITGIASIEPVIGSYPVDVTLSLNRPATNYEAVASRQFTNITLTDGVDTVSLHTTTDRVKADTADAIEAIKKIRVESGNLKNRRSATISQIEADLEGMFG